MTVIGISVMAAAVAVCVLLLVIRAVEDSKPTSIDDMETIIGYWYDEGGSLCMSFGKGVIDNYFKGADGKYTCDDSRSYEIDPDSKAVLIANNVGNPTIFFYELGADTLNLKRTDGVVLNLVRGEDPTL